MVSGWLLCFVSVAECVCPILCVHPGCPSLPWLRGFGLGIKIGACRPIVWTAGARLNLERSYVQVVNSSGKLRAVFLSSSFNLVSSGGFFVWTWAWKQLSQTDYLKKMDYDFGGMWTPDLCWSFMTGKALRYSVSPGCNLRLDVFCSFIKDKPLSYSVNDDWVLFYNITNTSIYLSRHHIYYRSNIITRNPSQLRSRYLNQVIFDTQTQTKSFAIPKLTIPKLNQSRVRSHTLKSSQYRPPRQKPSQSRFSY